MLLFIMAIILMPYAHAITAAAAFILHLLMLTAPLLPPPPATLRFDAACRWRCHGRRFRELMLPRAAAMPADLLSLCHAYAMVIAIFADAHVMSQHVDMLRFSPFSSSFYFRQSYAMP